MDEKNRKRILSKLDDMMRYVDEINMMLPSKEEYLKDLVKRRACEKTIEVAIESLIDAAAVIVSAGKMGLPTDEESIFDLLQKKEILDGKLCERAKEIKGFRNVLIRRYANLDDEIVYHNLKDCLSDFYDFEKAVKAYLKRNKK